MPDEAEKKHDEISDRIKRYASERGIRIESLFLLTSATTGSVVDCKIGADYPNEKIHEEFSDFLRENFGIEIYKSSRLQAMYG